MSSRALRVMLISDPALVSGAELPARVAAILAGVPRGSVAIQLRAKELDGGPLLAQARALVAVARPLGALVWINDRVDVARLAGADGVHLPEHGLDVADARAIAGGLAIGCSRHTVVNAITSGADLVQVGAIFDSPGKRAIGLAPLPGIRDALGPYVTLVAVGGIDSEDRAARAAEAGADAVAVIRAAWTPPDPVASVIALIAGVERGRTARRSR